MDIDLNTQADQLQSEAKGLIEKLNLIKLLSDLGNVHFVGSYVLNLMFRPDIDIFITSDQCALDQAIAKTKALLDTKLFQTIGFANHLNYPFPGNWRGLYWELKVVKPKKTWKFDLWYTSEWPIKSIEVIPTIKSRLQANSSLRLKILKRKSELFDGTKYRDDMNGFKIYEEILGKLH